MSPRGKTVRHRCVSLTQRAGPFSTGTPSQRQPLAETVAMPRPGPCPRVAAALGGAAARVSGRSWVAPWAGRAAPHNARAGLASRAFPLAPPRGPRPAGRPIESKEKDRWRRQAAGVRPSIGRGRTQFGDRRLAAALLRVFLDRERHPQAQGDAWALARRAPAPRCAQRGEPRGRAQGLRPSAAPPCRPPAQAPLALGAVPGGLALVGTKHGCSGKRRTELQGRGAPGGQGAGRGSPRRVGQEAAKGSWGWDGPHFLFYNEMERRPPRPPQGDGPGAVLTAEGAGRGSRGSGSRSESFVSPAASPRVPNGWRRVSFVAPPAPLVSDFLLSARLFAVAPWPLSRRPVRARGAAGGAPAPVGSSGRGGAAPGAPPSSRCWPPTGGDCEPTGSFLPRPFPSPPPPAATSQEGEKGQGAE